MQDLQGPRVRLGAIRDGRVAISKGQLFDLLREEVEGDETRASSSYESLIDDVKVGEPILIADGRILLRALQVDTDRIRCVVEVGGPIHSRAGLNLPATCLSTPALTPKDLADAELGLKLGVDFVALSFVSSALDVQRLRALLAASATPPRIIAKIERPRAVEVIDEIMQAADGVMIARGDLGVELPPEQVPLIQKDIIKRANIRGKTAVTATQMLESMRSSPTPTRAEASDVANAVLDGTDAVMLSGETANGEYPLEAVRMMDRIIRELENSSIYRSRPDPDLSSR